MSRLILSVLLLAPLLSLAQGSIYRTVDENGNVVFTDAPPADAKGSQRVDVGRTNTAPPPPQAAKTAEPEDSDEDVDPDKKAVAFVVRIITPPNETTIPKGPGNFSVGVRVSPALEKSQNLQLFMDGAPWGSSQRSPSWTLTNVNRGEHDLTVAVISDSGDTLASSEPVRVYVQRPSVF